MIEPTLNVLNANYKVTNLIFIYLTHLISKQKHIDNNNNNNDRCFILLKNNTKLTPSESPDGLSLITIVFLYCKKY